MKLKKVLIYLAIACCNGTGDVLLKRGMDNVGQIHLAHWTHIFSAFIDPWVIVGVACLAGFFYAYLTALSWADLTFVLPATAFGYVVTAFLSRFFLHEAVSPWRWAGVVLITCGVGLVARGPSLTVRESEHPLHPEQHSARHALHPDGPAAEHALHPEQLTAVPAVHPDQSADDAAHKKDEGRIRAAQKQIAPGEQHEPA